MGKVLKERTSISRFERKKVGRTTAERKWPGSSKLLGKPAGRAKKFGKRAISLPRKRTLGAAMILAEVNQDGGHSSATVGVVVVVAVAVAAAAEIRTTST